MPTVSWACERHSGDLVLSLAVLLLFCFIIQCCTGVQEQVNCRRSICVHYHSKPGICIQPQDFNRVCCNNSSCITAKDPYLHSLGCDRVLQHHCGLYFTRILCINEGVMVHQADCPFCLDLTDGTICTRKETAYPADNNGGTTQMKKLSWYGFLIGIVPLSFVCCCFLLRRKCKLACTPNSSLIAQQSQSNVVSNDIVSMDVQYVTRVQVNRGFLPDHDGPLELSQARNDNPPPYSEVSPPSYEEAIKLQQINSAPEIFSITK